MRTPRTRLVALGLALALLGAGCAGSVGKYRHLAAGGRSGNNELSVDGSGGGAGTDAASVGGVPGQEVGGGGGSGVTGSAARTTAAGRAASDRAPSGATATGGGSASSAGGSTVGVTPKQVAYGLFYPQTGAYTAFGVEAAHTVQAALNEVNEQGGIYGRQLVLKTYDDGTGNASTIAANERTARGEAFVFNDLVSTGNEVLAPLADHDRVPLLAGNITESLARSLHWTFTQLTYWGVQAKIMPGFIVNRLNGRGKRIAVVFEATDPATAAKNAFKKYAADAGLTVVYEQPIDQNQAACTNEVSNLRAHNADVVVMINGPLGAICMIRDGRTLGYNPTWTGFGGTWNLNLVSKATGGQANGISTLGVTTTLETPAGQHFSAVIRKYYPNSSAATDDVMLLLYSQAQEFIEALRRVGADPTREKFVQVMETKMNGWDSGYLPPPQFAPGDRSGPSRVSVTRCCAGDNWTTTDAVWRSGF